MLQLEKSLCSNKELVQTKKRIKHFLKIKNKQTNKRIVGEAECIERVAPLAFELKIEMLPHSYRALVHVATILF